MPPPAASRSGHDHRHQASETGPRGGVRGVPRRDHRRREPLSGSPRGGCVSPGSPGRVPDRLQIRLRRSPPSVARLRRARWLERAEPHTAAGPLRRQFVTGLESWFTLPEQPGAPPPPPYKMAMLTWITLFPLITGVVLALDPLLEELAPVPRLAITTAVTVPLMTWVVMPRGDKTAPDLALPGAARSPQERKRLKCRKTR